MNYKREWAKQAVGPGWAKLIDKIYDRLPEDCHISQVKSKWGGLRFYVHGVDEETQNFIASVERESTSICEVCGRLGKPCDNNGWIETLCNVCQGKKEEEGE